MVLLISYDLKKADQNYDSLFKAIESYGTWWHHLGSTWLIETEVSPKEVLKNLQQYLDTNDKLIIFQVANNWWATGLLERAYDWLKQRKF